MHPLPRTLGQMPFSPTPALQTTPTPPPSYQPTYQTPTPGYPAQDPYQVAHSLGTHILSPVSDCNACLRVRALVNSGQAGKVCLGCGSRVEHPSGLLWWARLLVVPAPPLCRTCLEHHDHYQAHTRGSHQGFTQPGCMICMASQHATLGLQHQALRGALGEITHCAGATLAALQIDTQYPVATPLVMRSVLLMRQAQALLLQALTEPGQVWHAPATTPMSHE